MHLKLSGLAKLAVKILTVVLLGGFLGATLVRLAPGFGVDEEELDVRLSNESIQTLRQAKQLIKTSPFSIFII